MKISQKGIDLIKHFEGVKLNAYQDTVGVWTIGYGHTKGVHAGMTITGSEAENLLEQDLETFEAGVSNLVKVPINQDQYDALVSFAFNLGLGTLAGSTLLHKLNLKDYQGAAEEFGKWVHPGHQVLPGLVSRRKAEEGLGTCALIMYLLGERSSPLHCGQNPLL
jgi:lysozyme